MKLFKGESEPIAIDPILRGVDLALERLVQRDCFSDRTFTVIDELRAEVLAASERGQEVVYDLPVAFSVVVCGECGDELGGDPAAWRLKHVAAGIHEAEPIEPAEHRVEDQS